MSATKILWGQVITVFAIVLLAIWTATEWTAWRLGFQPELGTPWFELLAFPVLPAAGLLLVVVRLRRLRAVDLHRGRLYRRVGRHHRRGRRDRHVGLAGARSEERRDLRLRALGAAEGDRAGRAARPRRRGARPLRTRLSPPRRPGACAVLRADPVRQRRRPRHPVAADLARLGDRPRHQGRELAAHRRLPRPARPRAAVRSDQREVVRLQSAAGGPPRRMGSARRPEHRRHPGRSRKAAWRSGTIGRRPATRCWSARSYTSSMPRRTRRSPASPPSSPIRSGRSSRRSPP